MNGGDRNWFLTDDKTRDLQDSFPVNDCEHDVRRSNYALLMLLLLLTFFTSSLWITNADATVKNTDITVGVSTFPISFDPHHRNLDPSIKLFAPVYQALTTKVDDGRIKYQLAQAIEKIASRRWLITLKNNIYFSNGDKLNSADVSYSIQRVLANPRYFALLYPFVENIIEANQINQRQLEIITYKEHNDLPRDLSEIMITKPQPISGQQQQSLSESHLGTGEMRIVTESASLIKLEANPYYHGKASNFSSITYSLIADRHARLTAFKRGEFDLVDTVLPNEIRELQAYKNYDFKRLATHRFIHLQLDSFRDVSPYVTDKHTGKPLIMNPLKDKRVRQALSLAINRQFITDVVLQRGGKALDKIHTNLFSRSEAINKPLGYDLQTSRELLKQAGYPDGFALTIHCPLNSYIKDHLVCEQIAKMLDLINITVSVQTQQRTQYYESVLSNEYSAMLIGWGNQNRPVIELMKNTLMSKAQENITGISNYGRYSNSELDRITQASIATDNYIEKRRLLQQAVDIANDDTALIPLYLEYSVWACQDRLHFRQQKPRDLSILNIVSTKKQHS